MNIKQLFINNHAERFAVAILLPLLMLAGVPQVGTAIAESTVIEEAAFPVSEDKEARYEQWVVATAYSSDPWQTDSTPCLPAMQFDLCKYYEDYGIEDTVAANFLPLGTQVKFPELYGDKIFVVRDRMNARYNGKSRIDFWVGSVTPNTPEIIAAAKTKARGFGVKQVKMEVYAK